MDNLPLRRRRADSVGPLITEGVCSALHCASATQSPPARRPMDGYFFIAMTKAAISRASLRLSEAFDIVACGSSKNALRVSSDTVYLDASAASGGARQKLVGFDPVV